jgi:hypothetical protein
VKKKTDLEPPEPDYIEDYSADNVQDDADADAVVPAVRYEISSP